MFVVSCHIPKLSFKSDIVIFLQNYVVPLPGVLVSQILSCCMELNFLLYGIQAFSYKWEYGVTINLFTFVPPFFNCLQFV